MWWHQITPQTFATVPTMWSLASWILSPLNYIDININIYIILDILI
jgi:hypothetical protein